MNILITGVAGLIGSRMAEWLLENTDHTVIGVDDLSGGYEDNLPRFHDRFKFQHMDVSANIYSMDELFKKHNFDYVYHFAAYAAEGLSPFIRRFNYNNNLIATANIVNMCIKYDVKRLVFTSSMAVYGDAPAPFDESYTPNPIDPYGVAKYACEMDIQIAGEQHGLDWCIIRPHNVYGRNQNIWDVYRNVLGIWMWNKMHKLPFAIYGDGEQTRAFTDVSDILLPLYKAATDSRASKQIINLGGIHDTRIVDAAYTLAEVVGGSEIKFLEERHEVKHAHSTWQKSVDLLDFNHSIDLQLGLTNMWRWAARQPDRQRFIWNNYELDKGLYPFWKRENIVK